jgi:hypothetical protein
MNLLALADRKGLTIEEAEQMPVNHFNELMVYYKIIGENDGN